MDLHSIVEQIQTVCPKTTKDIEQTHNVKTYDGMSSMVTDLVELAKPYCFGHDSISRDRSIGREYDILIGFIAQTDCSFDTSFGGYSFGKRSMQKGEFQFALLDKAVPRIASLCSEFLVTNVIGSFYAVFANIEQQMRKSAYVTEEFVFTEHVKLRHGQLEKRN